MPNKLVQEKNIFSPHKLANFAKNDKRFAPMLSKFAYITIGPSSCGKSTWAAKFLEENRNTVQIERDQIRFECFSDRERNWTKYKFNNKNENIVTMIYNQVLNRAFNEGKNLLLTDTWLNNKYRNQIINRLEKEGYEVIIKDDWDITWDILYKRNIQRLGGIPTSQLWLQWQRWLDYKEIKRYVPDLSKPPAIICDIDGTLADHKEVRGPHDEDKVHLDKPIILIIDLVQGLSDKYKILFFSGRSEKCRDATAAWLVKHVTYCTDFQLYMRKAGDRRRDSIVKEEMFWEYAEPHYNIVASIDDRNTVVRDTWSKLGIKCIHVGHMYEEF